MNLKKFLFSILLSLPKNEHQLKPVKNFIKSLSYKNSMRFTTKSFLVFLVVIFLGICNSTILTPSSGATTWTVDSTADSGLGTLRDALVNAQANDTIIFAPGIFPPGSPATITLSSNVLPSLSQGNITIDGSNAGVILDGSSLGGWPDGIDISSDYNIVKGLELQGFFGTGITVNGGKFNVISDNTIISCGQGITINSVFNTTIINNTVNNNNYNGINVDYSDNNTITNNSIHDNILQSGVWLDHANNNTISDNFVYNNNEDGIRILVQSNDNDLINNTCYNNNWAGIRLQSSCDYNTITNNTAYGNGFNGILIEGPTPSNNNIVTHNVVHNNAENGIALWQNSSSNTIFNNTIRDNERDGIQLDMGANNTLINNTVYNHRYGILLWDSKNNTIENNSLTNNGFYLGRLNVESYLQKSMLNNSVNGKPLILWKDKIGGTVPNNAGQIILFNCTDITIADQTYSNTSIGILTAYCSRLIIHNNTFYNSRFGIFLDQHTNESTITSTIGYDNRDDIQLWSADNNIVNNNTLGNNSNCGLVLDSAEHNTFSNNTIFNTNLSGIYLWGPNNNNNSFFHNIINDNKMYGITIEDASSNTIVKFNDFIGNNIGGSQANDSGATNVFEYNYWSDWTSPDGNVDGVVDNPYSIDGTSNNRDQYPLVTPPSIHHLILPIIASPSEGTVLSGNVIISWTASVDTWGFPVQYFVYYSTGGSWTLLASNLTVTSYTWDTSTVPDGTNYLLKVEAISKGGLIKSSTISIEIDNIPPPPPLPPDTTPTTSKSTTTTKITPGWNILIMLPFLIILLSRRHYKKEA